MNSEIKLFRALLQERKDFFESNGYIFETEEVSEENTNEESFRVWYRNVLLKKKIAFDFFPSLKKILKNQISIFITENEQTSINIPAFLAYKELNRRITYGDQKKYFFKVDPQNLEETINQQLDRIIEILNTDMKELFTTEAWMSIPQVHPFNE